MTTNADKSLTGFTSRHSSGCSQVPEAHSTPNERATENDRNALELAEGKIVGWTFRRNESVRVLKINDFDRILNLLCDYCDYSQFITVCHQKSIHVRAINSNWDFVSVCYLDHIEAQRSGNKNLDMRLQVQIVIPDLISIEMLSEIWIRTHHIKCEATDEAEKMRYLWCKLGKIFEVTEIDAELIPEATEFDDMFILVGNIFKKYDLDIFDYVFNIING